MEIFWCIKNKQKTKTILILIFYKITARCLDKGNMKFNDK